MSLLDNSTNEQLLQNLKNKKFNDSLVLAFLECSCYIQNLVIRQKEPASEICVVPFSNFGNWITSGPLRIRCLLYIWTTLLITVYTFAVVIISLHIRKYAILLHLAWLNSKNLGFTLFLLYSHKGWTAAIVCDSVYSLPDSGFPIQSALPWTAISYKCDATTTFFYCTTMNNKWRTSYQYFLFRYLHSTSFITNCPTWSLNAARWSKKFRNDASTYWSENHFLYKTRNSHGTPLHVLRNPC